MSTTSVCSKCGSTNFVGARFCQNCGGPLQTVQEAPPSPSTFPPLAPPTAPTPTPLGAPRPVPYSYGPTDYGFYLEGKRRERIDRTKTGLLLIIVGIVLGIGGSLVSAIGGLAGAIGGLVIGAPAGVILLIGAIFVILGREAFGKTHSDYVLWSVGLYVGGGVVGFIFGLIFAFSLIQVATTQGTAGLQSALTSDLNLLLIGSLIGTALTGLARVLFTYALQKPFGRILLWAGYVGGLTFGLATLYIVGSQIASAVQSAASGGTFNRAPIDQLRSQESNLILLGSIPSIIYAVSYYLAWSRVNKGEIPEPASPPSILTSPIS